VLPFAIPYITVMVGSRIKGSISSISSTFAEDEVVTFQVDQGLSKGTPAWANYIKVMLYR
jgi:galactokinase